MENLIPDAENSDSLLSGDTEYHCHRTVLRDLEKIRNIFRYHLRNRRNTTVFANLKIIWENGEDSPVSDISIFEHVKNPEKYTASFSIPVEGVKPFFILEAISPRYRLVDIFQRMLRYRRLGLSEYIVADPGLEGRRRSDRISYAIIGYRLCGSEYTLIDCDDRNRIYSQTTDVWIGASESGERLIVWDGQTGEPILPDSERAEEEKVRAEQEKAKAEQERLRADRLAEELRQLKAKLESFGESQFF